MEEIYSEESIRNNELPWGQWKFSLSNEEIDRKLSLLPKLHIAQNKDCEHWSKLFSLLQEKVESADIDEYDKNPDIGSSEDVLMECSSVLATEEEPLESVDETQIDELIISLVDLCNQAAPKLKLGVNIAQEEMESLREILGNLRDDVLSPVMEKAWSQLNSEASKLCFCIPFSLSNNLCKMLCQSIIMPWISKSPPSKLEVLSTILSSEGDIVCRHLVAPLLQNEESALAQDVLTLEELMASMKEKHWTALLRELLADLRELHSWQIPSLAVVVEHAEPSDDEVHLLVQLMSSSGTMFAQSRDFGTLLVAVAKSCKESSGGFGSQLKLIANNYKGPLKFKALKILDEVGS